jgi:hypothetical protein
MRTPQAMLWWFIGTILLVTTLHTAPAAAQPYARVGLEWGDCAANCEQTRDETCSNGKKTSSWKCRRLPEIKNEQCCRGGSCTRGGECAGGADAGGADAGTAGPEWEIGDWGACDADCGAGERKRTLLCKDGSKTVGFSECKAAQPARKEDCTASKECDYQWKYDAWSSCKSNTRTRDRSSKCEESGKSTSSYHCFSVEQVRSERCICRAHPLCVGTNVCCFLF